MFRPIAFCVALCAPLPLLAETAPLKTAEVSRNLYDMGVAAKDPLLVLTAAKLRKSLVVEVVERAPETPAATEEGIPHLDWRAMLAMAEEFAVGNKAMLGLIDDVRIERAKGLMTGPVYSIARIGSGKTDTYAPFPFEGEAYAEVYLEGNGDGDLNLFVYDQKNRLVCSDSDASQIAYCGWTPDKTANFKIEVKNKGPRTTSYSLMTN